MKFIQTTDKEKEEKREKRGFVSIRVVDPKQKKLCFFSSRTLFSFVTEKREERDFDKQTRNDVETRVRKSEDDDDDEHHHHCF